MGELLIGVVIGNIGFWLGIPLFVMVMHLGEAMPLFSEVWLTGRSMAEAASEIFSASELAEGGSARRLVEMMTGPEGPRYVAMTFALWLFSELGVILLLFMGVFLKIDTDKHEKLAKRFGVSGLPDIRFLAPDGTPKKRLTDCQDAETFAKSLQEFLNCDLAKD